MKKYRRNIIILVLISFIVLYFSLRNDFSSVMAQVFDANIYFLLITCVIVVLNWLIRSLIIHIMIKPFRPKFKFRKSIRLILLTNFFSAVTPFATGGQPAQLFFLKKDGLDVATATIIMLQNLIIFQLSLFIIGITSISLNYFLNIFEQTNILRQLVLIGFSLNTLLLVGTFILSAYKELNKKISKFIINILSFRKSDKEKYKKVERWHAYLNRFHDSALHLRKNKKLFFKTLVLSLIEVLLVLIVPWFLLHSITTGSSFNLLETMIGANFVILSTGFIPLPGASGGREISFLYFFGVLTSGASVTALMLLWRFITYYFPLAIGTIALVVTNKRKVIK